MSHYQLVLLKSIIVSAHLSQAEEGKTNFSVTRAWKDVYLAMLSRIFTMLGLFVTRPDPCVSVTIQSAAEGALMKGFLVQARDPLTGQSARDVGAWLPAEGVKGLPECAAATHSDRNRKTGVVLTWQGSEDVRIL